MKEKVLLVDNFPGVGDSLDQALRLEGYDLTLASNGKEALNALRTTGFDMVVLDLNVPVTAGWAALSQIVTTSLSLPLIIITGRPDQQPLATHKGVTAVLEKPLDLLLLLGVMARALAETSRVRGKGLRSESSHLQ
jgi:DNA-binding NtrC family response regulator